MVYQLIRLAPGSYDVVQDGTVVAALVRSGETSDATWTAELLQDRPPQERPTPSPRSSTALVRSRRPERGSKVPWYCPDTLMLFRPPSGFLIHLQVPEAHRPLA